MKTEILPNIYELCKSLADGYHIDGVEYYLGSRADDFAKFVSTPNCCRTELFIEKFNKRKTKKISKGK